MSETSKKRVRESTEPTPETMPHVPEEQPKGESPSRLETSQEPTEDEEKRRVAKKLREREQGPQ